jgi:hypothetical protein
MAAAVTSFVSMLLSNGVPPLQPRVRMLVQAIEAFIGRWNQNAAPFKWTKHEVHQQEMKHYYADLCN